MTVVYLYALLLLCIASIPVYIFIITVRRFNTIYEQSLGDADSEDSSNHPIGIKLSSSHTATAVGHWTINTTDYLKDYNTSEEQLWQYRHKLLKLQNYQSHLAAAHINGFSTGKLTGVDRSSSSRNGSHSGGTRNDSSMHATASNRSSSPHQTNRTRSKLAYLKHPPSLSFDHLRQQAFSDEYDKYIGQRLDDRACGNGTIAPPLQRAVSNNLTKYSSCVGYVYNQSRVDKLRDVSATRLHHSILRRQYAHYFYNLSLKEHLSRVSASHGAGYRRNRKIPRLHLIRVPKASSSSLSMVARRMVGCHPPGPCCKVKSRLSVDCNSSYSPDYYHFPAPSVQHTSGPAILTVAVPPSCCSSASGWRR